MRRQLRSILKVKGFTLIELLAVMAIIGILAAIVVPAVAGTGETGRSASAQESASAAGTAANDFFSDQTGGETLSTSEATLTTTVNGLSVTTTDQVISSRWPEAFVAADSAATYAAEFPISGDPTDGVVIDVTLVDSDGIAVTGEELLDEFTAISFDDLVSGGFMTETPDAATSLSNDVFHNFLWLFRKFTSASSSTTDDSRTVVVFKLQSVTVTGTSSSGSTLPTGIANTTVELAYEQVF